MSSSERCAMLDHRHGSAKTRCITNGNWKIDRTRITLSTLLFVRCLLPSQVRWDGFEMRLHASSVISVRDLDNRKIGEANLKIMCEPSYNYINPTIQRPFIKCTCLNRYLEWRENIFNKLKIFFPLKKARPLGIAKNKVNQMLKLKYTKHTIVVLSVQKV